MKFYIENYTKLDPFVLSNELIAAFGSNFGISTAGNEITTNSQHEPDAAAFQSVLDAHVAAAPVREFNKAVDILSAAVQKHIDATAKRRGYDNAVSCASYSASTVQAYKDDALAIIAWRDSVWNHCLSEFALAKTSGIIPTETDLIAGLPPFTAW